MRLSREDNERLDRLASEVKKGGGLALPLFFSTILIELLDNGPTSNDRMVDIVTKVGANKTKKLAETWRGDWAFLTADLMQQLASKGYVSRNGDDRWHLGENFREGELETIPYRKGLNRADTVSVVNRQERDRLGHASYVEHEAERLSRHPRGKTHSQSTIKELRDSAERFGPLNPILVDERGQIIDGRHRRDIDPNWPTHTIPVSTAKERIEAILELDRWHKKNTEDLSNPAADKIREILDQLPGANAVKREQIEAELHRDAQRSDLAISEQVGVSHHTVTNVRGELESDWQNANRIHCYRTQRGGRNGGGKIVHLADCWCGEGDASPPSPKKRKYPNQHPPFTPQQEKEFYRLRDEGVSWTGCEAAVAGFDQPLASLTTRGQIARARYEARQQETPQPPPIAETIVAECNHSCPRCCRTL